MIKYLKYFISTFTIILAIWINLMGGHYPILFFIGFSAFIILGDIFLKQDMKTEKHNYPNLLNVPIYLNLLLLFIYVLLTISLLSNQFPVWMLNGFETYFNINLFKINDSYALLDKMVLIFIMSLNIGIMGTVPGHELTHRKRNKLDMFIGNWLLAMSWDCAFAIEHVYGHHKNVCLPNDPASAKRGENIYAFILRAIIKEQKDAWMIELDHLQRRGENPFSLNNRMIKGYVRSSLITITVILISGFVGMMFYLLGAFIAKSLLEGINYIEHYGLVREPGKPVLPKHSWNSNHVISSIYLYNVTRHSSHHEKPNLKFWELETYQNAPTMPLGYLFLLYLVIFSPFLYHKIMVKELIKWDSNHASNEEREIAIIQNKNSGMAKLKQYY